MNLWRSGDGECSLLRERRLVNWAEEGCWWRNGGQGSNKAAAERVYQGRGAMSRRIQSHGTVMLGELGLFLLFFSLLSFFPSLLAAQGAGNISNQTFAVVQGVNLSSYDESIQQAVYSAYARLNPGTGTVFGASLTGDLSNVTVQAVRLRVGSLRRRGVTLGPFTIPPGVKVLDFPFVRVILVYRDFGNVSVYSSPVEGQVLVSPVVGIKVYNGDTLSSIAPLAPLSASALSQPIQVNLTIPENAVASHCVEFNADGTTTTSNVTSPPYACFSRTFGDFALVGSPPPGKKSNKWKIILGTVLGVLGVIAIASLLLYCCRRQMRKRQIAKMQSQVDQGETLQPHLIGNSRAPVASETRTRPTLEKKDYLET